MSDPLNSQDDKTPFELLPVFYKQYNLEYDGGQSLPYVRIELLKKIIVYIPNFKVRKKAIFKHDVHHLATGYQSNFRGETEIGSWEIGSGIKKYWIAFMLDIQAVMIGILFNPAGVFKAFVRGRRTKNLYTDQYPDTDILHMKMGEIRKMLKLDIPEHKAGIRDLLVFILLLITGLIYSVISIIFLPFVIIYSIYIFFRFTVFQKKA